jgi:hypothetical protein
VRAFLLLRPPHPNNPAFRISPATSMVWVFVECSSISCTTFGCVPLESKSVAQACLKLSMEDVLF